jgi:endonuclease/exonuclease/phosphatase family metal-dependent hydrolase
MRVLLYNILDGGGVRLPRLLDTIKDLAPDIAVLCELNGWHAGPSPLPGYHLSLNTSGKTPYRVGVLSREQPAEVVSLNDGLHHRALLARFQAITIVAVHLHPFEEAVRIREAVAILKALERIDGPLVIAGDFNSCLPDESGISGRSGALERLFAAGFDDPGKDHVPSHTLCTALSPDDPYWRFDYILSRGISWSTLRTLHDPAYAELSDHWPVLGSAKDDL